MNLSDYKRMAGTMFPGQPELLTLIEQVWDSARRSGSASSAERKSKKVPIEDWSFDLDDLTEYVIDNTPPGAFTFGDARAWASEQLEAMREWAGAKGERKVDWGLALKGWLRRSLQDSNSLPWRGPSARPSRTSQAAEEHQETFREAMKLNSRTEPRSPSAISSGTASRKTRRVSPSSSRTQPRFL